jgi:regulation of enolase protein 1 (concanavalin A-like superfamily)
MKLLKLCRSRLLAALVVALLDLSFGGVKASEGELLFHERFEGRLQKEWKWVRESPEDWRVRDGALQIRVVPGNMWGPANDARNVLVRPVPEPGDGTIEARVTVKNRPTEQYEQVNIVWYYADSHMVKLGQEMVDGQLSIVMGREENDRTRTIAIIPIEAESVDVRFLVTRERIRGEFRPAGVGEWALAGETDLPVKGSPNISLQTYQGPRDGRWVELRDVRVYRR